MSNFDSTDQALLAWFPTNPTTPVTERKPFAERDLREISEVLRRSGKQSWSRVPRLYSTLRIIDQLPALEVFLKDGITDMWFPFRPSTLPATFRSPAARCDFLDAQKLVLTKALELEKEDGRHHHFSNPEEIPFRKIAELGKGGFGYVDKVLSTVSYKEYARKLIPRGRNFRKDREVLKDFERELVTHRKLSHTHIVQVVGSYTDPKYVGIIMLPVADCNLQEFLAVESLSSDRTSFLRTFFGCLTSAVKYLHENRIRHKDIKPQNVLVKDHQVLLTDFGISRDWTELGHSTTSGPTIRTPRYCAPEIAAGDARNSSADIWSLGCVFLEIWTVLTGKTVSALNDHLRSSGSKSNCYYDNYEVVVSWLIPEICWFRDMIHYKPSDRPTAQEIFDRIQTMDSNPELSVQFIGLCCLHEDDTAESVQSSNYEPEFPDHKIAQLPPKEFLNSTTKTAQKYNTRTNQSSITADLNLDLASLEAPGRSLATSYLPFQSQAAQSAASNNDVLRPNLTRDNTTMWTEGNRRKSDWQETYEDDSEERLFHEGLFQRDKGQTPQIQSVQDHRVDSEPVELSEAQGPSVRVLMAPKRKHKSNPSSIFGNSKVHRWPKATASTNPETHLRKSGSGERPKTATDTAPLKQTDEFSESEESRKSRSIAFRNALQRQLQESLEGAAQALQSNLKLGAQDRSDAKQRALNNSFEDVAAGSRHPSANPDTQSSVLPGAAAQIPAQKQSNNASDEESEQARLDKKRKALQEAMNASVINGGASFKAAAGA